VRRRQGLLPHEDECGNDTQDDRDAHGEQDQGRSPATSPGGGSWNGLARQNIRGDRLGRDGFLPDPKIARSLLWKVLNLSHMGDVHIEQVGIHI
jgi:hypothetical protein